MDIFMSKKAKGNNNKFNELKGLIRLINEY